MDQSTSTRPAYNGGVAFSPDGACLVWIGQVSADFQTLLRGNSLYVFDLRHRTLANCIAMEQATADVDKYYLLNLPTFSPDGKLLALADSNWKILIWDWARQEKKLLLPGHSVGRVSGLAFSPDGRRLASSGCDYRVRLWDVESGRQTAVFKGSSHCESVAFSPDGERLAWGTEPGRLTLLDIATRKEIFNYKGHTETIGALAFSPDGRILAINYWGGPTKLLDADNGRELYVLNSGWSWGLRFSPDNRLLSSVGMRGSVPTVLLCDLQTKECTQFATPHDLPPLNHYQRSAAFSPDCKIIAYVGATYDVSIWNTDVSVYMAKQRGTEEGHCRMTPSTDHRTAAEKAAAATQNKQVSEIRGMPVPTHLALCSVRLKSKCTAKRCTAKIRCSCANEAFQLQFAGRRFEDDGQSRIGAGELVGGNFLLVTARCAKCLVEHLLFDKDLHGWNGLVCRSNSDKRPRPVLQTWTCNACGAERHSVRICLSGEGRTDAIEESGGILDESNWQDGFGFVDISIRCCDCGNRNTGWVSYETM